jgi:fucose 4-O-acetylase-like acetyltransferase
MDKGMRPVMPSRETVWFVPLVVISLLVAMSLTIFLSPAIGVPLLVLAGLFGAIGWFRGNSSDTGRMNDFRDQATADVEFTERDRETLTPTQGDPAR